MSGSGSRIRFMMESQESEACCLEVCFDESPESGFIRELDNEMDGAVSLMGVDRIDF